jgi:large subunit ribosomal protein L7/L12
MRRFGTVTLVLFVIIVGFASTYSCEGGSSATPGEGAVEEKTEFDVVLIDIGSEKIKVIKVVRSLTGLGLYDAKNLVESAPSNIKVGVSRKEAEEAKSQLEESGAKVELK